jgi:hypothetical protein
MSVFPWLRDRFTNRARDSRPRAIALVSILLQKAGIPVIGIAAIVVLVSVSFKAGAPESEDLPGSGIIVRAEVTGLWIPGALHDVAQSEAGAPVFLSQGALVTELKRRGLKDTWYALTYRVHKVNGDFEVITQIRRLSEAADRLDELEAVMAAVAGRPPRYEGLDFSDAKVEIIPETLQAVDLREAVIRLLAEPVVGNKSSPTGGLDSAQ